MTDDKTFVFEKAFNRLEDILEKLNSGETGLDDSLKLYEEADRLIGACTLKLNEAEKKIETLIKNRNGTLQTQADGRVVKEDFKIK